MSRSRCRNLDDSDILKCLTEGLVTSMTNRTLMTSLNDLAVEVVLGELACGDAADEHDVPVKVMGKDVSDC